jgi:hypothetical protein
MGLFSLIPILSSLILATFYFTARGEDISATKGQSFIVPGILLERANPAGLDAFLSDLKSKMAN